MDDDENLHKYGTPLEPLEKDEVPAKKPVAIEDQIVRDENGKRRFHGAFTGGFSAGFWNTVGSLEGWTPRSFKSSRQNKTEQYQKQRPEDFMDAEDLGEFGIAPQGIRTREDFAKDDESGTSNRKRKLMQPMVTIPGVPVLEQLLKPVHDKAAVRILKSMGWKPGQGVGPRQTRKEKKQIRERNKREQYLMQRYGCGEEDGLRLSDAGGNSENKNGMHEDADDDDDNNDSDEDITFAPDDYEPLFYTIKDNRFGLGYSGLSRAPILTKNSSMANSNTLKHINLFRTLEVMDKNRKLSITGQGFGVGALEEEDEDIYDRDDMSRYDFSLGGVKQSKQKATKSVQEHGVIEGFEEDKTTLTYNEPFTIEMPRDFKPRNWAMRKSRFAPMEPERARRLEADSEHRKAGLGRHDMNPEQRGQLLNEQAQQKVESCVKSANVKKMDKAQDFLERINVTRSNFTCGGLITAEDEKTANSKEEMKEVNVQVQQEHAKLLEKVSAKTKHLDTSSSCFKPFLADEAKQLRYEEFLESKLQDAKEIAAFLSRRQPITMGAWDRELEVKEFIQARNLYKPLAGLMSDRFVSETVVTAEQAIKVEKNTKKEIVMKRTKTMWKPSAQLCKRYNIAEQFGGAIVEQASNKSKMSVFDYLEFSVNTKANFQTPVIIPKQLENIQLNNVEVKTTNATTMATTSIAITKTVETANTMTTVAKLAKNVPKTELEQRVEATQDIPISEKADLYALIFDDSDNDSADDNDKQTAAVSDAPPIDSNKTDEEIKQEKLVKLQMELGLPVTAKTAAAVNVLRNNSPPRGLFATLLVKPKELNTEQTDNCNVAAATKIEYKKPDERIKSEPKPVTTTDPSEALYYGPKIPSNITKPATAFTDDIDSKIIKLWQQQKRKDSKEQWVEKQVTLPYSDHSDNYSSTNSSDSSNEVDRCIKKKKSKKAKDSKNSSDSKRTKSLKKKKKKKSKKKKDRKHEKMHKRSIKK